MLKEIAYYCHLYQLKKIVEKTQNVDWGNKKQIIIKEAYIVSRA